MLCDIGYRDARGVWHQESLNDFGDTWLDELLHLANVWQPSVAPHVEWLHVFVRKDDRRWSKWSAIDGGSKP